MKTPKTHPRSESLKQRERLVEALKKGILTEHGLIAHGRGEAFDYLLNEETKPPAEEATKVAAQVLLNSRKPVLSVNGNTAALVPKQIAKISDSTKIKIEINLFHRTKKRIKKITDHLKKNGLKEIYGKNPKAKIPGLDHERGKVSKNGIYDADSVIVPLEDGDRTKKLKEMNKTVIAIDLNPLSRTSKNADITIVDNITRALPNLIKKYHKEEEKEKGSKKPETDFKNQKNLKEMEKYIRRGYD